MRNVFFALGTVALLGAGLLQQGVLIAPGAPSLTSGNFHSQSVLTAAQVTLNESTGVAVAAGATVTISVACTGGGLVVAGGWTSNESRIADDWIVFEDTNPNASSWRVVLRNRGNATRTVYVHANCLKLTSKIIQVLD